MIFYASQIIKKINFWVIFKVSIKHKKSVSFFKKGKKEAPPLCWGSSQFPPQSLE